MSDRSFVHSFAGIVSQALPGARRRYTQELADALSSYFHESIQVEDGRRYLALEWVEITDNPMWRDVTVGVKLQHERSAGTDLLAMANQPKQDQPRTWTLDLTEGAAAGGEQVFVYTFRHTVPVHEGLRELRDLVTTSYVPRERAIERLKQQWDELGPAQASPSPLTRR